MKKNQSLKKNIKTFGTVLKFLKLYRIHFILSLLLTAVSVGLTLLGCVLHIGDQHSDRDHALKETAIGKALIFLLHISQP